MDYEEKNRKEKRQMIAAFVLGGIVSWGRSETSSPQKAAELAYDYADALLAESERKEAK